MLDLTWVLGVQDDGRVRHRQSVVFDVHLVGRGQLGVVEDLVLAPGHVSDAVFHLEHFILDFASFYGVFYVAETSICKSVWRNVEQLLPPGLKS